MATPIADACGRVAITQSPFGRLVNYEDEPPPGRFSPWRRWLRRAVALAPVLLGVAALGVAVDVIASAAGQTNPAFVGAIVGAVIATFGNLVLQYLLALLASWRLERERNEREIAMLTVLMAELGAALVAISLDVKLLRSGKPEAIDKVRSVSLSAWESFKLDIAGLWRPRNFLDIAEVYTALRLTNEVLTAKGDRLHEKDFPDSLDHLAEKTKQMVKVLEKRLLRIGRA